MEESKKSFWIGIGLLFFSMIILAIVFVPFFLPKREVAQKPVIENGNGLIEGAPDVPGDCASMSDGAKRKECFNRRHLSEILYKTKNIKDCLMFDDLTFRNDCLFREASLRMDGRYCGKLSSESDRSRCVQDVAINSNNPALCHESDGDVFESQECVDRVKATNIGKNGDTSLPLDYCAKIKTLEYGKLCVLDASRNGVELTEKTGETVFKQSFEAYVAYRAAKTEADCQKIQFEGARLACSAMIKDGNFDYDKDGIADYNELWFGTDPSKADTDGDGLSDYDEIANGCDPSVADTDHDGLSDYQEVKTYKSSCSKPDSDNDGIKDGEAVKLGKDPISNDQDRDGLADDLEKKIGTDPLNPDTDGDGMSDGAEWNNGFNPLKKGQSLYDTDQDGLNDIDEIFYGTDRFKKDTDGDGKDDLTEIQELSNPTGPGDLDFDMDGLTDLKEKELGTNPTVADTDGDGKSDLNEAMGGSDSLK